MILAGLEDDDDRAMNYGLWMEQQPLGEIAADFGPANLWIPTLWASNTIGVDNEVVLQDLQYKLQLCKSYCIFMELKINC